MKRSAIIPALLIAAAMMFAGACSGNQESETDKTVEVHVTAIGMHCGGCEETIETTFMKMPGVDSVHADYTTADVYVRVDTTQTSYERLQDLVSELGFDQIRDDMDM